MELWPDGGRVGRPWVEGARGGDALARAGAPIKTQLGELLTGHEIRLRSTLLRVQVDDVPAPGPAVVVTVFDDIPGGFETARVAVPDSVADLDPAARWWLALQVLLETASALQQGTGDGFDRQQIEAEMLARGATAVAASRWISAPGRRHRARVLTVLPVDQPRRSWIDVLDARTGQLVGASPTASAVEAAASLPPQPPRWTSATSVSTSLLVDHGALTLDVEELTVDLDALSPAQTAPSVPLATAPATPPIEVRHFSTNDPTRPSVVEFGGINGEPHRLSAAHRRAWGALEPAHGARLTSWWKTSGLATLHLSASTTTTGEPARVVTQRDGRDLWVDVAIDPQQAQQLEPDEVAQQALRQAVASAARRARIPPCTI